MGIQLHKFTLLKGRYLQKIETPPTTKPFVLKKPKYFVKVVKYENTN